MSTHKIFFVEKEEKYQNFLIEKKKSTLSGDYVLHSILTFTTLWAFSADDRLMIFFLFFQENRI